MAALQHGRDAGGAELRIVERACRQPADRVGIGLVRHHRAHVGRGVFALELRRLLEIGPRRVVEMHREFEF